MNYGNTSYFSKKWVDASARAGHKWLVGVIEINSTKTGVVTDEDDFVYAKPGDIYAIYLKQGGSPKLDLTDAPGNFRVLWYDPRNGGKLQEGDVLKVAGGAQQSLGSPPKDKGKDWAVLVRREGRWVTEFAAGRTKNSDVWPEGQGVCDTRPPA